ncbi:MAG: response regulator [Planctomycetes bacterium]|nr:response regulator [Planctomycetota bacterium]
MKILVVDDDEISLEMLKESLTKSGHEALTASDGKDAADLCRKESIRMVISDWMMPGMNGLELCKWIRTQGFPWYVYIILLTARKEASDVVQGLSAGADEFLVKPFDPIELEVRIRTGQRILSLETRHVAIFALARLTESRDPETGHHLERIREYSRLLALQLSTSNEFEGAITSQFVETIYLTSPLHDIGKVGIPDCILLKPGRLTDAEFNAMKLHTTIGGDTLDAAARQYPGVEYLRMASDIALTHHEQYDGSGYPKGLKAENIPLCGRIVCLADVYDALTSKRVYKPAFTHDVARNIILNDRGKHFDPHLVDAFIDREEDFVRVAKQFSEARAGAAPEA